MAIPPPDPAKDKLAASRGETAKLALHAVKWNYIGVVLRASIQLVAQIVLARFLGPAEFGYYALCFMMVGAGYLIAEMGLSSALIQTQSLTQKHIQRVWTLLLISGATSAGFMLIFAEELAYLLDNPDAVEYLRFSAAPLFLQVITSIALALLRKSLDFKHIQISQLTGIIVGQVLVGFTLAAILHTAWAMLWAWLMQLLISWILMLAKVRHGFALAKPREIGHLLLFGIRAFTTNIANWLIENLDNFFVARFFGARSLGLYAVSYNLVRYPTNHLVTTLQSVLFPTSAAMQNDPAALRVAYVATLSLVALVTIPMFISIALLARPLILTLYGQQWEAAIEIMQPLALAMPLHAITAISGPLLWGMNRVGTESLLQWCSLLCFLGLIGIWGLADPVHLAWTVFGAYFLRALLLIFAITRILDLKSGAILRCFRAPLILGLGAIASAILALRMTQHAVIQIGSDIAILISVFFILFWIVPSWMLTPSLARVLRRFHRLPSFMRDRIGSNKEGDY